MKDKIQKNKKAYIYGLYDPSNHIIRYIGFSTQPKERLKKHRMPKNNPTIKRDCWIKSLQNKGSNPEMLIIEECNESIWPEREIYWINEYRKTTPNLTNINHGGFGRYGFKHSKKTIKKIQETRKKNGFSDKSRKIWSENCIKMHKGIPLPESVKLKISKKLKGRKLPKKVCKKMSIAAKKSGVIRYAIEGSKLRRKINNWSPWPKGKKRPILHTIRRSGMKKLNNHRIKKGLKKMKWNQLSENQKKNIEENQFKILGEV